MLGWMWFPNVTRIVLWPDIETRHAFSPVFERVDWTCITGYKLINGISKFSRELEELEWLDFFIRPRLQTSQIVACISASVSRLERRLARSILGLYICIPRGIR